MARRPPPGRDRGGAEEAGARARRRRPHSATLDDLREAVGTLEAVAKLWKRVMGERHPEMAKVQSALATVREKLADARASESKPPP